MAKVTDHFTAVVSVEEVFTEEIRDERGRSVPVRDKREVTKLVIKAKSLESLRAKITAHVALVDGE